MVKTLTGGHSMKNMEKSGTGSDRKLERSLNQTGFLIKTPNYIRVYNQTNTGQYVLAVGDIESFPISVIVKMLFTLPSINSAFWDEITCPEAKIQS